MEQYREKVKRLASERAGEPFFNSSEDHAAVIVETMFRAAKSDVCILTSHLAPRVYAREKSVEWAEIFLADDENHRLRIIAREGDLGHLESNPLFKAIRHAPNFEVRSLEDSYHDQIEPSFMLADNDCFRFEPDKRKCEAVAAFGSKKAEGLRELFEKLWGYASKVNLDNLTPMEPQLL